VHDRWVRVPTVDKPQSKNGAYIWDGQAGAVQNWAIHEKPIGFYNKNIYTLTEEQIQERRDRKAKAEKQKLDKQFAAKRKAVYIMNNAEKKPHPYTAKKGFPKLDQWVWNGFLVVPMRVNGSLVGCQLIDDDGNKKFLYGQVSKGAEAIIYNRGVHYLCEGFATGLSIKRALKGKCKYTIHICFSAQNILELSKKYNNAIVVADNDDIGIRTAKKTGLLYWASPCVGEDFNDYVLRVGSEEAGKNLIAIGRSVAS
jgi:putative DNA primase/helicase